MSTPGDAGTTRPTLTRDYQRDWPGYFDAVKGQPARETLVRALDAFEHADTGASTAVQRVALDIACGEGRDTREMLRRSGPTRWRVIATDSSVNGLERLQRSLDTHEAHWVTLLACRMEDLASQLAAMTPPSGFDLVNASFALPFCDEAEFPRLWAGIVVSLRAGGRFSGQFFGDRDEWAPINPRRHVTRDEALARLVGFTPEHFEEVEKNGSDAMGGEKHHHVFHIVARKNT